MSYVGLPEHLEDIDRRVLLAAERTIRWTFEAQGLRVNDVVATVTIVNPTMVIVSFIERGAETQTFEKAVSEISPKIVKQSKALLEQAQREDHMGMLKILVVAAASRRIALCHLPLSEEAPS